jgi:hypothetical protein
LIEMTFHTFAPMEKPLFQLQDAMQEITSDCKGGQVQLCDHATSLLKFFASNIQNNWLIWANESHTR